MLPSDHVEIQCFPRVKYFVCLDKRNETYRFQKFFRKSSTQYERIRACSGDRTSRQNPTRHVYVTFRYYNYIAGVNNDSDTCRKNTRLHLPLRPRLLCKYNTIRDGGYRGPDGDGARGSVNRPRRNWRDAHCKLATRSNRRRRTTVGDCVGRCPRVRATAVEAEGGPGERSVPLPQTEFIEI